LEQRTMETILVTKTQADVDQAMRERGIAKQRQKVERIQNYVSPSQTPAGVALVRRSVEPIVERIKAVIASKGTPGFGGADIPLFEKIDPYLMAYLTMQACIDGAIQRKSLLSVAVTAARAIEAEVNAAQFAKDDPLTWSRIVRRTGNSITNRKRRAKGVIRDRDAQTISWSVNQALKVGTRLVACVEEATGLITTTLLNEMGKSKRLQHRVAFTEKLDEWMADYNAAYVLTKPIFLPMVERPKPWTTIYDGGYYVKPPTARETCLITAITKGHREVLEGADLSSVFQAVNALQETPWAINTDILAVMVHAWEHSMDHPALPDREDRPMPPWTDAEEYDERGGPIRKIWRRQARLAKEHNNTQRGRRLDFLRHIRVAQDYQDVERLYFPYFLDFRGRAYPLSSSISPQGADHSRALLRFAQPKVLGSEGWDWLRIHGANLFGEDKIPFQERIEWVEEHHKLIRACAQDPHGILWWTEADSPWQFLAFCFEYSEACEYSGGPEEYPSSLVVHVDGSCNGLQHYAALLRDEEAGRAVNLVPGDTPQDIYRVVAECTEAKLRAVPEDHPDFWHAQGWLSFGIDRKITKRAVMTVPYAVSYRSALAYVREAVREKIDVGDAENPFGEAITEATLTLGHYVWEAIQEVVTSAIVGMAYLKRVAQICNDHQQPIIWRSPIGLVCYQGYRDTTRRRVRTKFHGSQVVFSVREPLDTLDTRKQLSAIAPNFIHSMDASALMFTVNLLHDQGIRHFAMVHDSYGTHAANMAPLNVALRAVFVAIYQQQNWLLDFAQQTAPIDPGPPPAPGDLDVREVMHSPYFFA
jgi:DNA-directed RNA polymerase, mitochondrial